MNPDHHADEHHDQVRHIFRMAKENGDAVFSVLCFREDGSAEVVRV